ncbi:uncharacterized protein LOC136067008 [Quercus suber]|uniref:uncharacterized protein LOC136067008 n=1 Tax=Quercus suber TaxID=58331 RepID=UPI0032DF7960
METREMIHKSFLCIHFSPIPLSHSNSLAYFSVLHVPVPLSLDNIFEEVIKSEEGRVLTLVNVRTSLVQLGCSASARGTADSYSIVLKKIIESAQNDEKLVLAPNRNILLWKVNKRPLWEHVLDEMFHAALNLSLRAAYEWDKEKEVINPLEAMTKEERQKQKNIRILLDSSLLKLDDAIMLFHNF